MLGPPLWNLPDPVEADEGQDLLGVGGDLDPATLLDGYRQGLFAMHLHPDDIPPHLRDQEPLVGWWSPDPRGVLIPSELVVSTSLWRAMGRFQISVDTAFSEVVAGCADPTRPHGWITPDYIEAYEALHAAGYAHSIEVWDGAAELAGGLLCVEVGGFVAAESKFRRVTNASKVAVVALAGLLEAAGPGRLIDVQWWTDHLGSLGASELSRDDYRRWLGTALTLPPALTGQGITLRPARSVWSRTVAHSEPR